MHFVDRGAYLRAPIAELLKLDSEERSKWLEYKKYLDNKKLDKTLTKVNAPSGRWTEPAIKGPLMELFKNNCGYCGDYADEQSDGEVDHFCPKKEDLTAEKIYSWNNYVWACHTCNNRKRNYYPLINPCDKAETAEVYFNGDGRYLVYTTASKDVQDKYKLTIKRTAINGKKAPQRRRNIKDFLESFLDEIKLETEIYEVEQMSNPTSEDTKRALDRLNQTKEKLRKFLESTDFILLKISLFEKYRSVNPSFNYKYEDFSP